MVKSYGWGGVGWVGWGVVAHVIIVSPLSPNPFFFILLGTLLVFGWGFGLGLDNKMISVFWKKHIINEQDAVQPVPGPLDAAKLTEAISPTSRNSSSYLLLVTEKSATLILLTGLGSQSSKSRRKEVSSLLMSFKAGVEEKLRRCCRFLLPTI